MGKKTDVYYKYSGFKGLRWFRLSDTSLKVIQVCESTGESKRGRANAIGIYMIDRLTFIANYTPLYPNNNGIYCTKKQYEAAKKRVEKLLK